MLLGELDELIVVNAASANEDHAVGRVVGLDVLCQVGLLDREDVLLGAEDGAAKRLALESYGVKVVKDDLLVLLVNLLLLPQDDVPLALNGRSLELRVLQNVRDDVNSLVDVLAERLGVVDGLLARRVGVEVGAQVLDLELEGVLRAAASTCAKRGVGKRDRGERM